MYREAGLSSNLGPRQQRVCDGRAGGFRESRAEPHSQGQQGPLRVGGLESPETGVSCSLQWRTPSRWVGAGAGPLRRRCVLGGGSPAAQARWRGEAGVGSSAESREQDIRVLDSG